MHRTVQVRYYAQLRDALKTSGEEVAFEFPAREREILEALAARHPGQRGIFLASRVAVDDGFVASGALLHDPSGLDIISPISGG
jgi:molybdopterin converting factor small subunit